MTLFAVFPIFSTLPLQVVSTDFLNCTAHTARSIVEVRRRDGRFRLPVLPDFG
jgi:hypothetical protein